MWPFRMPPFAGHPGIPDPGLTTGDWLTLLLTAAIAVAAVAQAFIAYRIWRPDVDIWVFLRIQPNQRDSALPVGVNSVGVTGHGYIDIQNLSSVAIWVEKVLITAEWAGKHGSPIEMRARFLIGAYGTTGLYIEGQFFQALRTIPELSEVDSVSGSICLVVCFNAHRKNRRKIVPLGSLVASVDGTLWQDQQT